MRSTRPSSASGAAASPDPLDGDDRRGAVRPRGVPPRHVEPRAARRRVEPSRPRCRSISTTMRRRRERQAVEAASASGRASSWRAISSSRRTRRCARFKTTFADLASAVDTRRRQPAAGVLRSPAAGGAGARRKRSRTLAAQLEETARRRRRPLRPPVARSAVVGGDRRSGASASCLAAFLTIAAALTVANVVRLALYARRDEIEIMQLVGAPQTFIRGPFVMEGVLQGGIGALLALAALALAFLAVRGPLPRARWRRPSTCRRSGFWRPSCACCSSRAAWWSGASAGWWPRAAGRYRILTPVFARHYTGLTGSRAILPRGPACHAS